MGHKPVALRIYTVGHSTRSEEEFFALLSAHRVAQIADIRTVPRSRRHPHFSRERLEVSLPAHGVAYRHFPELGGLRQPRKNSPNTAWRNKNFQGYADHMLTLEFERGVEALLAFAAHVSTAAMCAEAVWWRCHRSLLADALIRRGVEVLHITAVDAAAKPHTLCEFARELDGKLIYPALL